MEDMTTLTFHSGSLQTMILHVLCLKFQISVYILYQYNVVQNKLDTF